MPKKGIRQRLDAWSDSVLDVVADLDKKAAQKRRRGRVVRAGQEIEEVLDKFRTLWETPGKGKDIASRNEVRIFNGGDDDDLIDLMQAAIGLAKEAKGNEWKVVVGLIEQRFNALIELNGLNTTTYTKVRGYWWKYKKDIAAIYATKKR